LHGADAFRNWSSVKAFRVLRREVVDERRAAERTVLELYTPRQVYRFVPR
jgi:hypothetical protein